MEEPQIWAQSSVITQIVTESSVSLASMQGLEHH